MDDRHKSRLQLYKNSSKTTQDLRTKRHEVSVELRKSKKEDQMLKRRNIAEDEDNENDVASPLKEAQSPTVTMPMEEMVSGLQSSDPAIIYQCMKAARRILSREKNPPIDLMIENGIVPICIHYLDRNDLPDVQFEAAWALTNVASGTSEQTMVIVNAGAIPKLIKLMETDSVVIGEQAVWALGNIAGDGPTTRDTILEAGALDILIKLVHKNPPTSFLRNIVWLMSNLCRNKKPAPPFDKTKEMLGVLMNLLQLSDTQILIDGSWAISYITDVDNDRIQAVIDAGIVPHVIRLMDSPEAQMVVPALRAVGNIVTGTDRQTESVIEHGGLIRLRKLLQHERNTIVKEATWAISNILAGNQSQVQAVIDANIMPIVPMVLEKGDFRTQKEAAWIVTNLTQSGSPEQICSLLNQDGFLKAFLSLFDSKDARTIKVTLTGLTGLFHVIEKVGGTEQFCYMMESLGALDKLEALQNHDNEEIYNQAYQIIDRYFGEENAESQDIAPKEHNGVLQFSAPTTEAQNTFDF